MKTSELIEKFKRFFTKDKIGIQLYSFAKTYLVVFGGIYFFGIEEGKNPYDWSFILETAQYSLISVLRNVWKIITE